MLPPIRDTRPVGVSVRFHCCFTLVPSLVTSAHHRSPGCRHRGANEALARWWRFVVLSATDQFVDAARSG